MSFFRILSSIWLTLRARGEELGLPEVAEMTAEERQDPSFFRTRGKSNIIGRDGCRVPLPWSSSEANCGFGNGKPPHLPMPTWWSDFAVDKQVKSKDSTLALYRKALRLRRELQCGEHLGWIEAEAGYDPKGVMYFRRPNGWEVLVNSSAESVELPAGRKVVLSSGEMPDATRIPSETTVWLEPLDD